MKAVAICDYCKKEVNSFRIKTIVVSCNEDGKPMQTKRRCFDCEYGRLT